VVGDFGAGSKEHAEYADLASRVTLHALRDDLPDRWGGSSRL